MVDAVRVLPRRSERLLDAGRDVPDHVQHSTNAPRRHGDLAAEPVERRAFGDVDDGALPFGIDDVTREVDGAAVDDRPQRRRLGPEP